MPTLNRQVKLTKKKISADLEETEALIELLFEASKCNNAHCARLLNISHRTWKKWTTTPPTEWYWPLVLRQAIKHTLASIVAQRKSSSLKFQRDIMQRLARIPNNKDFEIEIADMAYTIRGAELHLRNKLQRGGMWWSDLQRPGHSGGYTKQSLRKAAAALHVVKTQEGFGRDKDSFWRLPLEEED